MGVGSLAPPERLALQAVIKMSKMVSNKYRGRTSRMVTPSRAPNYATGGMPVKREPLAAGREAQ
jgi:hypothetical protein